MAEQPSESPVLDLLTSMTAESMEASSLDGQTLMLVRIAALVAVDAPPASYLLNLGVAGEVGVGPEEIRGVLAAVAPIVGTPRVASATGNIARALGFASELAELEAEARGVGALRRLPHPTGTSRKGPGVDDPGVAHQSLEVGRGPVLPKGRRNRSTQCPDGSATSRPPPRVNLAAALGHVARRDEIPRVVPPTGRSAYDVVDAVGPPAAVGAPPPIPLKDRTTQPAPCTGVHATAELLGHVDAALVLRLTATRSRPRCPARPSGSRPGGRPSGPRLPQDCPRRESAHPENRATKPFPPSSRWSSTTTPGTTPSGTPPSSGSSCTRAGAEAPDARLIASPRLHPFNNMARRGRRYLRANRAGQAEAPSGAGCRTDDEPGGGP